MSTPDRGSPEVARRRSALAPTLDRFPVDTLSVPPMISGPLPQLGRFAILRQLGAGGMGTVYAAYDAQLERQVALKLLHGSELTSQLQRQRVLREAKALARVTHPHVVSIYEVGEVDGHIYLAMEFVDGLTLRTWQQDHYRPWRELLEMYIQVGNGLCATHDAGVVHCELKRRQLPPAKLKSGGSGTIGEARQCPEPPSCSCSMRVGRSWIRRILRCAHSTSM